MSAKFLSDLNIGHNAEDFVAQIFEDRGYEIIKRATGRFEPWDFACLNRNGDIRTVEIKYDTRAHQTGNFYFEYEALKHSEADVLVYCYGQPISHLYFLPLKATFTRLRAYPFNVRGGDKKEMGWLLSKKDFEDKLRPQLIEILNK